MEYIKINCKEKIFKIKRKTIAYILYRLSDKDYSKSDDEVILKAMQKYHLIDEIALEGMEKF